MTFPADLVIAETRAWVRRAVIGLNLCPFARAVDVRDRMRYVVSDSPDPAAVLEQMRQEFRLLQDTPADDIETTLLILTAAFADFLDFNDFLEQAERLLRRAGWEGDFQIASFHPAYQFAGTGRRISRMPPTVHRGRRCTCCGKAALIGRWRRWTTRTAFTKRISKLCSGWGRRAGRTCGNSAGRTGKAAKHRRYRLGLSPTTLSDRRAFVGLKPTYRSLPAVIQISRLCPRPVIRPRQTGGMNHEDAPRRAWRDHTARPDDAFLAEDANHPVLRYRTLWISDLHLGTPGCQAEALLDFLRHTECETLFWSAILSTAGSCAASGSPTAHREAETAKAHRG